MPKLLVLISIWCFFTIFSSYIRPVEMQMGPDDYDDDYGNYDYPDGPVPPSRSNQEQADPYGQPEKKGDGTDGREINKKNEVVVGKKRFKLYERKRLNFKKAKEFCRRKEGKLAEANTLEEMRRLEGLFSRARMLGMDIWVGEDRRKWKKHSMKEVTHPGLNLNQKGMEQAGIKASLVGGGMKEMCPAISLATRNVAPVQCVFPLPFICEYDLSPKTTTTTTTTTPKPKKRATKARTTRNPTRGKKPEKLTTRPGKKTKKNASPTIKPRKGKKYDNPTSRPRKDNYNPTSKPRSAKKREKLTTRPGNKKRSNFRNRDEMRK